MKFPRVPVLFTFAKDFGPLPVGEATTALYCPTYTLPVLHFFILLRLVISTKGKSRRLKSSSWFWCELHFCPRGFRLRRRLLRPPLGLGLTPPFSSMVLLGAGDPLWRLGMVFSVSIWMEKSALQVASEDSCSWSLSRQCFSKKVPRPSPLLLPSSLLLLLLLHSVVLFFSFLLLLLLLFCK